LRDEGEGFGPLESGAFPRSEERSFAPGVEGVEALFGVAKSAGIDGMHVDAIGAAVDLRSAEFDEVEEFFLDGRGLEMLFEREHGVKRVGGIFAVDNAGFHGEASLL